MRYIKKIILPIIVIILLAPSYITLPTQCTPTAENLDQIIWSPEDEGDHFPCGCEWWTLHVALELEDGTHWDVLLEFQVPKQTRQTEVI